jgi:RHS repeat-associated protein
LSEQSAGLAALFDYRFSTKPLDQVTGLYYYLYRWYDPVTGRWPSRDPIEETGGLNLYGFVGNDPVTKLDKFGLKACTDCDGKENIQLNCDWTEDLSADWTRNADYYSLWDHKIPPRNPEHAKVIWTTPCGDKVKWIEKHEVVSTAAPSKARNLETTDNKTNAEMSVETWFFFEGLRVGNMPGVWARLRNSAMSGSVAKFCCCMFQNH